MGEQAVTSVGKSMLETEVARSCLLVAFVPRSAVDSCIGASHALPWDGLEQIPSAAHDSAKMDSSDIFENRK